MFDETGYRPVWYRNISEQYEMSLEAFGEIEKLGRFIEYSLCPSAHSAVRQNIFNKTKLDKEIKSNIGNKFTIFQSITGEYERNYRLPAPMKNDKFKCSSDFTQYRFTYENGVDIHGNRDRGVLTYEMTGQYNQITCWSPDLVHVNSKKIICLGACINCVENLCQEVHHSQKLHWIRKVGTKIVTFWKKTNLQNQISWKKLGFSHFASNGRVYHELVRKSHDRRAKMIFREPPMSSKLGLERLTSLTVLICRHALVCPFLQSINLMWVYVLKFPRIYHCMR